MKSGCCVAADGAGGYIAGSFRDRALFRIAADREVTRFATITGMAWNPDPGESITTLNFDPALRKISAEGSSVAEFTTFGGASAILVESGK